MEYYLVIKKNELESMKLRWMNLEPLHRVKISQKKKIMHINTYIWNLEKWYQ